MDKNGKDKFGKFVKVYGNAAGITPGEVMLDSSFHASHDSPLMTHCDSATSKSSFRIWRISCQRIGTLSR